MPTGTSEANGGAGYGSEFNRCFTFAAPVVERYSVLTFASESEFFASSIQVELISIIEFFSTPNTING